MGIAGVFAGSTQLLHGYVQGCVGTFAGAFAALSFARIFAGIFGLWGGSGSLGGGEEEVNLLQELQSLTGPRPMGLANLIRVLREPFSLRHSAGASSLSNSHVAQATSALRNKCGYVVH